MALHKLNNDISLFGSGRAIQKEPPPQQAQEAGSVRSGEKSAAAVSIFM